MVRLVILTVGRRRVMGVLSTKYRAVCVVRLVILTVGRRRVMGVLSTELCVW